MTPRAVLQSAIAVSLLALSCGSSGGGGGGALDCAWLSGSSNCWKSTATAAASCLPAQGTTGVLSADLKTCTYSTGQVITFDSALTLPLPQDPTLTFSITSGGSACLSFGQQSQQAFELTTSAGKVSAGGTTGVETVTCPNGSSVTANTEQALMDLGCDSGVFGGLPGTESSSTSTSVTFAILGAGSTGSLPVFECSTAMGM